MSHVLDTHAYDGHLPAIVVYENEDLTALTQLQTDIEKTNPTVLFFYNEIVKDKYSAANYDPTNGLKAYDLLNFLAKHRENFELSTLIEQFEDMRTGFCPQGRTTRLYQIVKPILDTV